MNKFIGIGRLTKDGELRTGGEIKIYTNSLAITNNFKNKEGNYDSEFINIVTYRATAEYLEKYAKKGSQIAIEGRIHTRSYEDKDKIKRYVTEVIVENANILDKKEQTKIPQNAKTDYQEKEIVIEDKDLPF